jgi:hypothetical protein
MLKDHEPDRNIEELSDEEINSAIHYLEPDSQYPEPDSQCAEKQHSEEQNNDRGSLAVAITFLVLLFVAVGFFWFYR